MTNLLKAAGPQNVSISFTNETIRNSTNLNSMVLAQMTVWKGPEGNAAAFSSAFPIRRYVLNSNKASEGVLRVQTAFLQEIHAGVSRLE